MFNPRLTETLTDFPFARLNSLIAPITPPAHLSMINMSVGEPQGAMPAFARQIVNDEVDGWNRYPPNQGLPDLNLAICEWLTRRYKLPEGLLDPNAARPSDGRQQGRRLHHLHRGDAAGEGWRQADRRAAQSVLSGLSRRRGAVGRRAAAGQRRRRRTASCRTSRASTRRRGSACRSSISARRPIRRAPSPARTICRGCCGSAASTTPCWRSTSATPRSTPASRRPGALEAALAMDETGRQGPVPQSRGLPFAVQALERGRPALGLHGGRSQARGDGAALAHLRRPADPLRRPEGVGRAVARGDASGRRRANGIARISGSPSRSCTTASATTRRAAASSCGSTSATARRPRASCGARRTSRCCRAPMPAARPTASTPPHRYIRVALVHDEKTTREGLHRLAAVL